jgi:hypothetical protein
VKYTVESWRNRGKYIYSIKVFLSNLNLKKFPIQEMPRVLKFTLLSRRVMGLGVLIGGNYHRLLISCTNL